MYYNLVVLFKFVLSTIGARDEEQAKKLWSVSEKLTGFSASN